MRRCIKQRHLFTLIFAIWLVKAMALEVTLPAAGTLKDYITPEQQETVTKLKVSGDINGDDLRIIRHMIGAKLSSDDSGKYPEVDSGACRVLDLADAIIIGEGFYTFKYVPKPSEGPAYYLPGLEVEANTITYAMFCGSKVETLILPNSVTYIGCTHRGATTADHCIDGSHLKSVTLPTQLEHMAIYGTGLALRHRDEGPDYYEEVPQQNLLDSPNLAEVKIADSNTHFKLIEGVLYRGDLTELMLCPPKREGPLEIPAETTKIGYRACARTHITGDLMTNQDSEISTYSFVLATIEGETVVRGKEISDNAFYRATFGGNLSILGEQVTIGEQAFFWANIKGNLTVGGSDIGKDAFIRAIIDGDVTIASVSISEPAFKDATVAGQLRIEPPCETIGEAAFKGLKLSNPQNLKFPETIISIGSKAFENVNLCNIEIADCSKLQNIGDKAFYGSQWTELILPMAEEQLSIGKQAFWFPTEKPYPTIDEIPSRTVYLPNDKKSNISYKYMPYDHYHIYLDFEDIYSPNDNVYLWIDQEDIIGSCPLVYVNWQFYPHSSNTSLQYVKKNNSYLPLSEFYGSGYLYIPKGTKSILLEYLNSQVQTIDPSVYAYGDETAPVLHFYPLILYFQDDHIVEIEMGTYPEIDESGVESISMASEAVEVARYDINGSILNKPVQGINIVRYSDGSVKKEFVK